MKKYFLVILFLFSTRIMVAQCPGDLYLGYGNNFNAEGTSIVTDSNGNMYSVGVFNNTIQLGAYSLTASGNRGVYLLKNSPAGSVLWAEKLFEATSIITVPKILLDGTGEIVIAGTCDNPASPFINTANAFSPGYIFMAKINPQTGLADYFYATGNQYTFLQDFTVDNYNNVYITGGFVGVLTCGGTSMSCTGTTNTFLVKFNPSNQVVWARRITNNINSGNVGNVVGTDANGTVYLAGWYGYSCDFGNGITLTSAAFPGYLAKYDSSGTILWAKQSREDGRYTSLLVAGTAVHVTSVSSGNATSIVKYNDNGDTLWTKQSAWALRHYEAGAYFALGSFHNSFVLDGTLYQHAGYNFFVAKLDSNMVHHEIQIINGNSIHYAADFAIDYNNNFCFTGAYYMNDTINGHVMPVSQSQAVLLLKLCSSFPLSSPQIPDEGMFTVYPNPVSNTVTIQLKKPNTAILKTDVINMFGERVPVNTRQISLTRIEADVSALPDGIYLLGVYSDKGNIYKKIIKQE